ncbi:MAG: hypothetical protein IJM01_02450 [Eubacterium sp.]|nr:hypothetical protein [Eubacterium sp.]
MRRKLENFDVMVGDIAITKTSRNRVPLVEVAYTSDDNIRALFTYHDSQYVFGNIPSFNMDYVKTKLYSNIKYLED